jgi:hypothetical protein
MGANLLLITAGPSIREHSCSFVAKIFLRPNEARTHDKSYQSGA